MLDLGWSEILVIAIVLIVVVGPKDLPRVLRSFGRTTNKLRAMAGDFRKQFDEALREAELDEVKELANEARKLDPRREIRKHLEPLDKAGREIRSGLDGAARPKAATAPADTTTALPAEPAKTGATAAGGNGAKPARSAAAKKPAAKPAREKKTPPAKPAPASKPAAKRAAPKPAARNKKTTGTAS